MSRLKPITIPAGVEVTLTNQEISVKGSKGKLSRVMNDAVEIRKEENLLHFSPNQAKEGAIALSGTARALINNMITGVANGFERKLQLFGVGYKAQSQGKTLLLTLGHSHPINYKVPEGITIETPSQTEIIIKGIDKQLVGQVAAEIREYRPPEPYKGKGVRYAGEVIILKEAKKK